MSRMLTLKTATAHQRLGALFPAARAAASLPHCRQVQSRPSLGHQMRNVAAVPGKDPDNMGGPGGQESLPESRPFRRRYAITTICGVLAACSLMVGVKAARGSTEGYVLVHDSSKGELDDVKYIKASDVPKS